MSQKLLFRSKDESVTPMLQNVVIYISGFENKVDQDNTTLDQTHIRVHAYTHICLGGIHFISMGG